MKTRYIYLVLPFILIISTAWGDEFGNIAIFADDNIRKLDKVKIFLDDSPEYRVFDANGVEVFWNIIPGKHELRFIVQGDEEIISEDIIVYPSLTNKVLLIKTKDSIKISAFGFADRTGQIMVLNRQQIGALPGELVDGIGLIGGSMYHRPVYSYDNMLMNEASIERPFNPSTENSYSNALINLSGPVAGYNNSHISLISDKKGRNISRFNGANGSRGRHFYSFSLNRKLTRNLGFIWGSLAIENLDDASPRWNVTGSLPHNNADNIEIMAGVILDFSSQINLDSRILYLKNRRNFYEHSFYFNIDHAPREEIEFYRGRVSLYGWVTRKMFIMAGFNRSHYESMKGDGLHFEDIYAYGRPGTKYIYDSTGMFYSWDDIFGPTEVEYDYKIDTSINGTDTIYDTLTDRKYILDGNEGFVYSDYLRYNVNSNSYELDIHYKVNTCNIISLNTELVNYTYRYYHHWRPVNMGGESAFDHAEAIGYDSVAIGFVDRVGINGTPSPYEFQINIGANRIKRKYSLAAKIDLFGFDANALAFKNPARPFGNDSSFQPDDFVDATPKLKIGCTLGGSVVLYKGLEFYSHYILKYIHPRFDRLFYNSEYVEYMLTESNLRHQYGNPDFDLYKKKSLEFGLCLQNKHHLAMLSYNFRSGSLGPNQEDRDGYIRHNVIRGSYKSIDSKSFRVIFSSWLNYYRQKHKFRRPFTYNHTFFGLAGSLSSGLAILAKGKTKLLYKILSSLEVNLSFKYEHDYSFRFKHHNGDYTNTFGFSATEGMDDFLEINVGLTARIYNSNNGIFSVRVEVLNLFNRNNYQRSYIIGGGPASTDWLKTEEGRFWLERKADIEDTSGLTAKEKFIFHQNNPNNFGRPRIFRVMARLEFM